MKIYDDSSPATVARSLEALQGYLDEIQSGPSRERLAKISEAAQNVFNNLGYLNPTPAERETAKKLYIEEFVPLRLYYSA